MCLALNLTQEGIVFPLAVVPTAEFDVILLTLPPRKIQIFRRSAL